MRIAFLDIDGVLAPFKPFGNPDPIMVCKHILPPAGCIAFDPCCVAELNLICESGRASIVVSSSWRNYIPDLATMREMLNDQGVQGPIIGMTQIWTRDLPVDQTRGGEIKYFLEPLEAESFVILDDCDMGFDGLEQRWVHTNGAKGLQRDDSRKAIELLNTPLASDSSKITAASEPATSEPAAISIQTPAGDAVFINPPLDQVFCRECQQCPCCCGVRRNHAADCQFRRAIECPVGIECEHGRDVCPICDQCTCGVGLVDGDLR